ncbi:hypothetical protein GIB67_017559 [Kingdonia uniflora]|uniref:Pentatricopeptide repeat-containing protein n=1 Tax=Kingdonia uniflora TaxID=39325 RepID=A0A7J7LMQ5_9MAGN|nr:hypothetical protein GIB67_017559 [Kingdonia uniflora]
MFGRYVRSAIATTRSFSSDASISSKAVVPKRNNGGSNGGVSTTTSTSTSVGRDTLGRRLVSLVHPKRSAVITISEWLKEGKVARKYELNRIVRELRKLKRYKHALESSLFSRKASRNVNWNRTTFLVELDKDTLKKCGSRSVGKFKVCEWMTNHKEIKLLPGDYAIHLDLVAKVRGLASADKFFLDLPEKMRERLPTYTALLHTYVQNNLADKAEDLMEKMSGLGFLKYPLPYNHMLHLYITSGQLEKVPELILALKKNAAPDVVTYNLWLSVCASQNDVERAEKVLYELKRTKIDMDWVTYSTLTNLYIKNDKKEKAEKYLKEMEKLVSGKSRVAFSSLLSLHTLMGDKDGLQKTWRNIKFTYRKMNDAEYICMISSLLKLEEFKEAEDLYSEWEESLSGTGDPRVPNLLLGAYVNKNQMAKAEKILQRMAEGKIIPSYTTWELLTWGYLKEKKMEKALDFFKLALKSVKKWEPNDRIVREIFDNLEKDGDVEKAEQVMVDLRNAGYVTTQIYNLLLRTYAKAGKMPLVIQERMKKDKVQLDDETYQLISLTSKLCVGEVFNFVK